MMKEIPKIILQNPYRILGVYANSRRQEIIANKSRATAFLNVNRPVEFPLDLNGLLPPLKRSLEQMTEAESHIAIAREQVKYAQFWFINKRTSLDNVALNHLLDGNIDVAIDIWSKQDSISSLQNKAICYLIEGKYELAVRTAEKLYEKFGDDYVSEIEANWPIPMSGIELLHQFVDSLGEEMGILRFLDFNLGANLKSYIRNQTIGPLIDKISTEVERAKKVNHKDPKARKKAGQKLIVTTKEPLKQLKSLLSVQDSQYVMIADKLGLEILQCGIDYFNNSENDDEAPHVAMKMQRYAQSIVVGTLAKQRCDENIKTLDGIIKKLPPLEVMENHKSIQGFLISFTLQPNLISYSIQLIKDCAPILFAIKEKIGKTHPYYLKISTTIAQHALSNVIAEVNEAQNKEFETLKNALISAWRTQLYLDKFDLEPEYKEGRYKENRETLHGIISECKGFEKSIFSFMYQYGCGWCNNLDVSDVELRTDEEYYQSCCDLASYRLYLEKFPSGKYVSEAKTKIMELRFEECHTITDYKNFIHDYPDSIYIPKAQDAIKELTRKEILRKERIARQEKSISACTTLNEVIELYKSEKTNSIDLNKCSLKAYELAQNEDDYRVVVLTFGATSSGGRKAKERIDEVEKARKEKEERWKKAKKWILWLTIPFLILVAIYLIWGIRGFAVGCTIIAVISGLVALGAMQDDDNGCGTFFICATVAAIFGFSAFGLHNLANSIEDENRSKVLYEQIINNPTEDACREYIQKFPNTDNSDEIREYWFKILLREATLFDYESYESNPLIENSSDLDNPIKKLQEFMSLNTGNNYYSKAESYLKSLCDSLYNEAVKKSTASGWRKYQSLVPTDYFKDSEEKIAEIENQAWDTEPKAWKMALSENSISAYEKYKSLYPNGSHIKICEKNLIDLEVSRVYAGDHGSLPEMDQTGYGGGSTSNITVTNSTAYTLTLLYSGPDSKRLVIPAGSTSSLRLKNGNYRVAASVSASNVSNYAGNENLQGGNYSVDYYISTYRY